MDEVQLNRMLWRIDPMSTGCNVNTGMEDEYANIARDIAQRLSQGQDARGAVIVEFDEWFWEGCLAAENRSACLEKIVTELMKR